MATSRNAGDRAAVCGVAGPNGAVRVESRLQAAVRAITATAREEREVRTLPSYSGWRRIGLAGSRGSRGGVGERRQSEVGEADRPPRDACAWGVKAPGAGGCNL